MLELKIPPPIVALLVGAAMWGISLVTPSIEISAIIRVVAATTIAVAGVVVAICGVIAFRSASTTINPLKPETTSALVTSGIFRITRNPMYVGLGLAVLGWAVYLSSIVAYAGPLVFVLYISRFQIEPEERALAALFGAAFADYQARVRRWL